MKNRKNLIINILMICVLCVFLYSLYQVFFSFYSYEKSKKDFADLSQTVIISESPPLEIENEMEEKGEEEKIEEIIYTEFSPISIDFEELKNINEDIIGWIYCEDTVINYPILKGEDNSWYLKHDYNNNELKSGSIFIDSLNESDFSDANTIIYGHNMKDGSMFHCLDEWSNQEFYDAHPYLWIITPTQDYKVVLFSGYTAKSRDESYNIYKQYGENFRGHIGIAASKSDFVNDVDFDDGSNCVMLSTCAYDFNNARYVLFGKLEKVGKHQDDVSMVREEREEEENGYD